MSGNGSSAPEHGKKPLEIVVTRHQDRVVMHFDQPREYVAMPASQASTMAEQLARFAFEVHYGRPAPDRGSELARQVKAKAVDEIRPRIITRVSHMVRSMTEKKQTPQYIAERVVDAVLKEVT